MCSVYRCNIVTFSVGFLFTFLMVYFVAQVPNLNEIQFSLSCGLCIWCHVWAALPNTRLQRFTSVFSKCILVLALKFRSLIHFELIFAHDVRGDPISFFCVWLSNCSRTICLKDYEINSVFNKWSRIMNDLGICTENQLS